jgi:hypothetical protein
MPTMRTPIGRGPRGDIPLALWLWLVDDPGWHDAEGVMVLYTEDRAALWAGHRNVVLPRWIAAHRGSRPSGWWGFESPADPRRRTGGTGTTYPEERGWTQHYHLGLPTEWATLDPRDPPCFESQAAYLRRHRLLTPEERTHLPASAYRAERLPCEFWPVGAA